MAPIQFLSLHPTRRSFKSLSRKQETGLLKSIDFCNAKQSVLSGCKALFKALRWHCHILVASGIGITPALSVIRAHKDTRRINLVWVVRDASLLEFFLNHLDHDGWNLIFYTGKKNIKDQYINLEHDTYVCIISDRPNLKTLIPNIIYGIESGLGLPENYSPASKIAACEFLADQLLTASATTPDVLEPSVRCSYSDLRDLSFRASELGYHLRTDIDLVAQSCELTTTSESVRLLSESIRENFNHRLPFLEIPHRSMRICQRVLTRVLCCRPGGFCICGGAKQVFNILEEISVEYEINVHVENRFDW